MFNEGKFDSIITEYKKQFIKIQSLIYLNFIQMKFAKCLLNYLMRIKIFMKESLHLKKTLKLY